MMPRIIVKALRKRNETGLGRITHEGFHCNRRHVAATGLMAGGLAAQSVNRLFHICLSPPAPHARRAWRLGGFVMNRRE